MNKSTSLFCHLSSSRIAEIIDESEVSICYAAPGLQMEVAKALKVAAMHLGSHMITVSVDFDERVIRMGYGDIEAVKAVQDEAIHVTHSPGLRSGLIIVDGEGYSFTPTPLYLEAESDSDQAFNALRLSKDQVIEALARLSPAAKAIAVTQAATQADKDRLSALPVEVSAEAVSATQLRKVDRNLKEAPPVKFDLARQVRVFESYIQYAELSLTGAAIQRHRLAIPTSIQKLGGGEELEGRLRTTFDLIEKGSKLSSKSLEKELAEIRKNFTPSLGKDHGRIVLKAAKPHLENRLDKLRNELIDYQAKVKDELQQHLDQSRQQIVEYYLPHVMSNPPDALLGKSLFPLEEKDGALWLARELDKVFPSSEALVNEMKLDIHYKDVTFETLNREDFLDSIMDAFPDIDWDKAYTAFRAAGELK